MTEAPLATLVSPIAPRTAPPVSLPYSANPAGGGGAPQPPVALHPVLEIVDTKPAPPLDVPGRSAAPLRGCSPSRHRNRIAELHQRDLGTPLQQSTNSMLSEARASMASHWYDDHQQQQQQFRPQQQQQRLHGGTVVPSIELASLKYAAAQDGEHAARAESPNAASCPVCGALRMPTVVDIGAGATLHALDRRKAELQREIMRIEFAIKQQRRPQSTADGSSAAAAAAVSARSPRLSGTAPATPIAYHQHQQHQSSSGFVGGRAPSNPIANSLIMDLRSTADSLMGSVHGSGTNPSVTVRGGHRSGATEHVVVHFHGDQQQSASLPMRPVPDVGPSLSARHRTESAASTTPFRATANHTHRRAASPLGIPTTEMSPLRDSLYSEDHGATLKELAMLRAERELARAASGGSR